MNYDFLILFFAWYPLTYFVDFFLLKLSSFVFNVGSRSRFFPSKCPFLSPLISYLFLHGLVYYWTYPYARNYSSWWILTLTYGLSNIVHPIEEKNSKRYTPLYNYLIHAAQALTVYYYHPELTLLGIFISSSLYVGGAIVHLNKRFLRTWLWFLISAGGVFAAQYHMMLLSPDCNQDLFFNTLIIWTLLYFDQLVGSLLLRKPYRGMSFSRIPFLHYFLIMYLVNNKIIPTQNLGNYSDYLTPC